MGDFTGFSFGNWHSSDPETGLVKVLRVSGGDRYEEELHPEIKDRTAEVPGMNGEYYFGSDYGTRTFNIEIAYDSLTESQFRELRRVFGTKLIQPLIFDERPYKQYMAKIESPIELSYVCFDEPGYTWQQGIGIGRTQAEREDHDYKVYNNTKQRIYKGEGTISFICYFPFAKSVFKTIPVEYEDSDWVISSGIKKSSERGNIDSLVNGSISVYNPGDIETGFKLYVTPTGQITLSYNNTDSLHLKSISLKQGDSKIVIDTTTNLIIGVNSSGVTTNNLYNDAIESGYFFHIPVGSGSIAVSGGNNISIDYDYLYF